MYKLPIGIRKPNPDEVPQSYDYNGMLRQWREANLSQGYNIEIDESRKWKFFARVNIDADRLWDLFDTLSRRMMCERLSRGMYGLKEQQPEFSQLVGIDEVLDVMSAFRYELCNSGVLEFGVSDFRKLTFCQIFINNYKVVNVYGTDLDAFYEVMNFMELEEVSNMDFVYDLPVVSEIVTGKDVRAYSKVIELINSAFNKMFVQ